MGIFKKTRKAPKKGTKKSPSVAKARKVFLEQMEHRLLLDAVTAHWVGGSGNWSDPTHWDLGEVPNDTASRTYQVVIDLAELDPTVAVDGNFKISGLTSSEILQVGSGGTLTASGAVTNTGQISSATGGTLKFENGTVQNTGHEILAAGGNVQLNNSTITGGTLDDTIAGGTISILNPSTFDAVTLGAPTTISNGKSLTVKNGLLLNSVLSIASSGTATNLYFDGTQTLSGTGEVVFAGTSSNNYLYARGTTTIPAALTIGPGITIHGSQGGTLLGRYGTDSIINQGTINADTAGKTVTIGTIGLFANQGTAGVSAGTLTLNLDWANTGTLLVSGGTLNLDGTFSTADIGVINRNGGTINITGALDNTGATLSLDATTKGGSLNISTGGTIKGGIVTSLDGSQLIGSGGTLDGVTSNAPISITSLTYVKNGLVLNSAITMESLSLFFDGTQTLSGTGEVIFAGSSSNNNLCARGTTTIPATLTIGPGITIHGTQGGYVRGWYGNESIINQGTITADTFGKTIEVSGVNWTNSGLLKAQNGGTLNLGGTISRVGAFDATGGTVSITGTFDNQGSTLTLPDGVGPLTLAQNGTIKLIFNSSFFII